MEQVFPFGFPQSTAGYLSLYVITFSLHQFCMHYVLAGSLYVSWCALVPGRNPPRADRPTALIVRDWLPFLLSAAITAGVAPLLFIQILYSRQFYSANLLLSWKWMAVVPVLIAGFYLLYVLKSRSITNWSIATRALTTLLTASCFVFVGFCWTINHLLGNAEATWTTVYATGVLGFKAIPVLVRISIWLTGSFVSFALLLAWQLKYHKLASGSEIRAMAKLGGASLVSCAALSLVYLAIVDSDSRSLVLSPLGRPYVVVASAGAIAQLGGWWRIGWHPAKPNTRSLWVVSGGLALSLLAICVLREIIRIASVDIVALYDRHAEASQVGGFGIFVLFAIINAALMLVCVRIVHAGRGTTDSDGNSKLSHS